MLKWAHKGGKGEESDEMKKSFQVTGKSKKSFKTSGSPPVPPSQTKSHSVSSSGPTHPSNGSTKSNGAPPSPANSHASSQSGELVKNVGQRTLEIRLPAGNTVTATVDTKLQMMDLLVMIAAKNKLNPTGHVVIPSTANRTDIAQFKASQRISELDTNSLQIVPKLSRGEIMSIRTSDKMKAAQFEQTVRLTVLSGKNHKALFRVNPEKPIQDFLPQVYDERGIEAHECRLRLVKNPDEDIDYSKSLNDYGGVNELVLIDLRPPPPQEVEQVPIEKKKKSIFGRKSKKKGENEPETVEKSPVLQRQTEAVVATSPPQAPQTQPVRQTSAESIEAAAGESNTLKKRRPAPPPPGAKKEPPHPEGQSLKPPVDGVSRGAHGISKKRRAPAPPPAGGHPIPTVAPIPESVPETPEVTVNGSVESSVASDQPERQSESGSEAASAGVPSPAETPSSTLERKKDGGDTTEADIVDDIVGEIEVAADLGELDTALTSDAQADEVSVSEVSIASNEQPQSTPAAEDPENGEKVQLANEEEEHTEPDTEEVPVSQSEQPTEDHVEEYVSGMRQELE